MPIQFPLASNQPEITERLIRALDLKGEQPGLIDGYYQLGITALDLEAPEFEYLRRSLVVRGHGAQAAVAGQFSVVGIGYQAPSPGTEDRLLTVNAFTVHNVTAGALVFSYGLADASIATLATGPTRIGDTRWQKGGAEAVPRVRVLTGSNAAILASAAGVIAVPPGASARVEGAFVCHSQPTGFGTGQGGAFLVSTAAVNQACSVSFEAVERAALSSER